MNHNNKLRAALKLVAHGWKIPEAKGEVKDALLSLALDPDTSEYLCAAIDSADFERCEHNKCLVEICLLATKELIVIAAMTETRSQFENMFELLHKYAELGGLDEHRSPSCVRSMAIAIGLEFLGLLYGDEGEDDSDADREFKAIIESKYGKPKPRKIMGVMVGREVSNEMRDSVGEAFLSGEIFDVISGVTGAAPPENDEWADVFESYGEVH